jgi:hypothetical protein
MPTALHAHGPAPAGIRNVINVDTRDTKYPPDWVARQPLLTAQRCKPNEQSAALDAALLPRD